MEVEEVGGWTTKDVTRSRNSVHGCMCVCVRGECSFSCGCQRVCIGVCLCLYAFPCVSARVCVCMLARVCFYVYLPICW